MSATEVAQYATAAAGLAITFAWARGVRAGRDPLGPAPRGDFPDLALPLLLALIAWWVGDMLVVTVARSQELGTAALAVGVTLSHAAIALALLPLVRARWPKSDVPAARQIGAGVYGGVATFGLVAVTALAVEGTCTLLGRKLPTQAVVDFASKSSGGEALAAGLLAIVLAPFAEEVLWRGVLLSTLARTAPVRTAITVQAILFGVVHVLGRPDQFPLAIPLAVVGWCAGWLAVRTRSIVPSLLLHATFNAIQFAFIRWGAHSA